MGVADTSGLLAALDSTHPEHQAANEAIMAAGLLVMSPLLLAEIDQVATRELGREAALGAVDAIRHWMRRGRIVIPGITEDHLGAARSLRDRYFSLDLDRADAVNVALAADYNTDAVLTLDRRDFRALCPLGRHQAFRVLPDPMTCPCDGACQARPGAVSPGVLFV